jgi:protein-L-isoaspartate O-methyltransferase
VCWKFGSASGWLVAVMARLVGNGGHVTGMEIIPELAAQSQADLGRLGIDNVSVLAADGAEGHSAGAPFDRVMITAATWDLPAVLFDQVAEGWRVLVPVELRGGGCQVTVLRRELRGSWRSGLCRAGSCAARGAGRRWFGAFCQARKIGKRCCTTQLDRRCALAASGSS